MNIKPWNADYLIVKQLMATFDYKPGFSFHVAEDCGRVSVAIDAYVLDSRKQHKRLFPEQVNFEAQYENPVRIGRFANVPSHILDEPPYPLFWRWLRTIIHDLEMHESDEWFRVDGELMFDPHPKVEAR